MSVNKPQITNEMEDTLRFIQASLKSGCFLSGFMRDEILSKINLVIDGATYHQECVGDKDAVSGPSILEKKISKIVVEVEGGVVTGVFSDSDFEYIVVDHDSLEDEDEEDQSSDLPMFSDGVSANDVMDGVVKKTQSDKSKYSVSRWNANRYVGGEPIGARCEIMYLDDKSTSRQYFSFVGMGEDDGEECECDAAGIPDYEIFYFADKGETELKELMKQPSDGCMNDFVILSYELSYKVSPKDMLTHEFEITDHREANGQLYVDIATEGGNVDDVLSATFEINGLTDDEQTQCMHLAFGHGENAASFFKYNDKYLIRLEPGATLERVQSDRDGLTLFELK